MKTISTIFLISIFLSAFGQSENLSFHTSSFAVSLSTEGNLTSIRDKLNGKEYILENQSSPILSISLNGNIENPTRARLKGKILILEYAQNDVEARITVAEKQDYLTFELTEIMRADKVEWVIWGPYHTKIKETVGESVGVVRNKEFAIGIQALNVKTLGGYPDNESDIEPAYDIFETGDLVDLVADWQKKKFYRGQTAKPFDEGSLLQAYTRNRGKDRIIENWGHTHYMAPAFEDGGILGSKIALFGCPPAKALEIIGEIELAEGLPHPIIDGEWAKTARSATASYLIIGFTEDDLDQALALTKKAGLKYLYHGHPFASWGHFPLIEKSFPDNWQSMKRSVDRAKEQGISLGVHTLSNFIQTNDPYVTPIPDQRLAKVGQSVIEADLDEHAEEIIIESPLFFNQMKNNSLKSVLIGSEIIRYNKVSDDQPWRLLGCQRGSFGTSPSNHKRGAEIGKLMDHDYKVFLSDAQLSEEIAITLANLFNETGLLQVSFDGLEGVRSTGMGQYARALFTKTWYDNLHPDIQGRVINDASNPSHFNWHINTRYNWGEPWYAGFRESQTQYRLMNQDFYRRNLLPSMLGWFSMNSQTSIEDTEWLLARAAGFDAGFAFNVNLNNVEQNKASEAIFKAINTWETARMAGAFTKEQKLRMEDIKNEFHLEKVGENKWDLYQYKIDRFVHEQKIRQPGEPLYSVFEFENPYEEQSLMFLITFSPDKDESQTTLERITIEINDYNTLDIPVKMDQSQVLKLDQTGKIELYDKNWNLLDTFDVGEKLPLQGKGKNKVTVDAVFSTDGLSKVNIEMKSVSQAESIDL